MAVVILAAVWGFSKGLAKVFFSLVGYILAFIVSRSYAVLVVQWLNGDADWRQGLIDKINTNLLDLAGKEAGLNGPPSQEASMFSRFSNLGFEVGPNVQPADMPSMSDTLAYYVMLAVASVLIFIVVKMLINIFGSMVASIIKKSGLLTGTDRLIGLMLGLILGATLSVFAIIFMAPIVLGLGNESLLELFSNSSVAPWILQSDFYQVNLTRMMFKLTHLG